MLRDLCLLAVRNPAKTLWIDMEASGYVDGTLGIYARLLADYRNAGICLQAYLHRTFRYWSVTPDETDHSIGKRRVRRAGGRRDAKQSSDRRNYLKLASRSGTGRSPPRCICDA